MALTIYTNQFQIRNSSLFNQYSKEPIEADEAITQSALGTPVYDNLVIESGSYIGEDGNAINYDGITINTVLINVSQPKNIVTTNINGRDGSIKEFFSNGDYRINFDGLIISQYPDQFPEAETIALHELLKVPDSLKITCKYLNRLDIYEIVVTDFGFNQVKGRYNTNQFAFSALSEKPIEIRKENE